VVLIPGLGMFTFGKTKAEARITGEFYLNAIHVMEGAEALGGQDNYVALPQREAFRIEYWQLEEAKLKRMPPEQELSRRIVLVAGGGTGVGRAAVLALARAGANVMVADENEEAAEQAAAEARSAAQREALAHCVLDVADRGSVLQAVEQTVLRFGGLDGIVNCAAPVPAGALPDDRWVGTLQANITSNYLLVDEAARVFRAQALPATVVLTSSQLVRKFASALGPLVRVNGVAPATAEGAETILFLTGERSVQITGQVIAMDAGMPPR